MLELIGGPKSAAVVGVTAVLAQVAGSCFDCPDPSLPSPTTSGTAITITGPDTVIAGEAARFSVEAQGLGGPVAPCPAGVNWRFTEKDNADPAYDRAQTNPPTRKLADGTCQVTLVQMDNAWPKARPGTSRQAEVRVRLNGGVINADGIKTITVVTPAAAQTPATPDTRPRPEDYKQLGSSLNLIPTEEQAESHQQDSVYWNTSLPSGGGVTVPEDGQVIEVKVKGKVIPAPNGSAPLNQVSVQVLRPDGDVMTVPSPGGSSAPFVLPVGGDADQITTFKPENLCTKRGDSIALNTRGGWDGTGSEEQGGYYDGVPFQIFAASPGASNKQYHKHDGTGNGARFDNGFTDDPAQPSPGPVTRENQELLMQVTLGTGNARSYECGGPNTYRRP